MFTGATSKNLRVLEDLFVWYERKGEKSPWVWTRHARKSYEYFGLDYAHAKAVAAAKVAKYTRYYSVFQPEKDGRQAYNPALPNMTSGVTVQPDQDRYKVVVEVNETDVISSSLDDPSVVFSSQNGRDYDDGDGDLAVLSARLNQSGYLTVVGRTGRRDSVAVVIQAKQTSGSFVWETIGLEQRASGGEFTRVINVGERFTADSFVRLTCGVLESDVVAMEVVE